MSAIEITGSWQRAEADAGPSPASGRFVFNDALRGLAALGVACYHIHRYGPLHEPASQLIPAPLTTLFEHGWMGVQVFFVISGFVIAYSVHGMLISGKFLGNFALRRSIRLDPPYWTTIFFVLCLYAIVAQPAVSAQLRAIGVDENVIELPSWNQLAAHPFYLQDVLGLGNISVGFWSLCIEVQFYLLLILLLGTAQWLHGRLGPASKAVDAFCLLGVTLPLALVSLVEYQPDSDWDMWIAHFFCMFFLGSLAWWTLAGRTPPQAFWMYVGLLLIRLSIAWSIEIAGATVAGTTIYLVGRRGHLTDWLSSNCLQYFGRISYSLYLIHYPVSWIVVVLGFWLTGQNPAWAVLWLAVALAASIGTAHLLYIFVEAPSVQLAKRFKPSQATWQEQGWPSRHVITTAITPLAPRR